MMKIMDGLIWLFVGAAIGMSFLVLSHPDIIQDQLTLWVSSTIIGMPVALIFIRVIVITNGDK
jgi:hypothetical protein